MALMTLWGQEQGGTGGFLTVKMGRNACLDDVMPKRK